MSYIFGKGTSGDLVTKDKRVRKKYRSISYEERVIGYGNDPREYFCLLLFYCEDNCPGGHIEIEFHKEIEFDKFKTRLEKAFVIRYEDTPRESEGDEFIGPGEHVYEESVITYANKLRTRRLSIFDCCDQKRKFIVEFENKRDRTNFMNILNKASKMDLNNTGEVNIMGNILWGEANRFLDEQNGVKAIEVFSTLLKLNPDIALAWERRGIAYVYDRQYDKAIDDFTQSIALDDNYEGAYNNRGLCYDKLKRYNEAIADYRRAIEIRPEVATFYANRGESHLRNNDPVTAISDFDKAIELDVEITETYNLRGEAYARLGEYGKAIDDFNRELKITPDNPTALANRDRVLDLIVKKNKGVK